MAKQGMKRPDYTHTHPKNDFTPVPEIQGKAKHGNKKANPIVVAGNPSVQKVYHAVPHSFKNVQREKSVSDAYPVIDNDVARDNLENDIPAADLQDL